MKTIRIRSTSDNVHYIVASHVTSIVSEKTARRDGWNRLKLTICCGSSEPVLLQGAETQSLLNHWEQIENPLSAPIKEVLATQAKL